MNMRKFIIKDILYTDNGKGTERESKRGDKYDARRGSVVLIDFENLVPGYLTQFVYEETNNHDGSCLYTTAFIDVKEMENNIVEFRTYNSIYILEELK